MGSEQAEKLRAERAERDELQGGMEEGAARELVWAARTKVQQAVVLHKIVGPPALRPVESPLLQAASPADQPARLVGRKRKATAMASVDEDDRDEHTNTSGSPLA